MVGAKGKVLLREVQGEWDCCGKLSLHVHVRLKRRPSHEPQILGVQCLRSGLRIDNAFDKDMVLDSDLELRAIHALHSKSDGVGILQHKVTSGAAGS